MKIELTVVTSYVLLLAVHWLGDFVLQTDWQAKNKSKSNEALLQHIINYSFCLYLFTPIIFFLGTFRAWAGFLLINSALHFVTDYFTSRLNSHLWAKGDVHNFFVSVGFDQFIHQVTLAVTMLLFFYL